MNQNKLSSTQLIRKNLIFILEQRKISYKNFAEILKMDYANIMKHIKGGRSISLKLLDKFAEALNLEPKNLLE